jgi:hypothetical protein
MSIDFGMDTPGISAAALATDVPGKLFAPAVGAMATTIGIGGLARDLHGATLGATVTTGEDVPTPGIEPQGNPGTVGLDSYVTNLATVRHIDQATQEAKDESGNEDQNTDTKDGDE